MSDLGLFQTLISPAGLSDPYPLYAAFRERGQVVTPQAGVAIATSFSTVDAALRDPALGVGPGIDGSMLATNPPDHTRMRRLVSGAFTPRRINGLRQAIEAQAIELLKAFDGDSAELMDGFAYQLPVGVICELLGVPGKDRTWFRGIANDVAKVLEFSMTAEDEVSFQTAYDLLLAYFADLVRSRRGTPQNDLISDVAGSDALTDLELLANLALLLIAGFETTTNLIGNGMMTLLEHPEHLQRLTTQPQLASRYVEEFLRHDSPVQATSRVALQETVLNGQTLEVGTFVVVLIGSANRDPAKFADAGTFNPDRPGNTSMSFGAGAHFCLGSVLARLEGEIAFPLLLKHLPGLALAGEPVRRNSLVLRGYDALPITWQASSA